MKYKYRNDKHVKLHGIEPFGEGVFDHPILGGGITLIEEIKEEKTVKKKELLEEKENE